MFRLFYAFQIVFHFLKPKTAQMGFMILYSQNARF